MSIAGNVTLTNDLTPEVLNAFRSVLVAHAQECFYDKASSDAACKCLCKLDTLLILVFL